MEQTNEKLSWKEIKEKYPDQWVELVDFDEDEHGYLINGVVVYHNKDRKIFNLEGRKIIEKNNYNPIAIRYTGEIEPLRSWQ